MDGARQLSMILARHKGWNEDIKLVTEEQNGYAKLRHGSSSDG